MSKVKVKLLDWGKISYKEAWEKQQNLHVRAKEIKLDNRRNDAGREQEHCLIFCEHYPVYTLGKSGSIDHLLLTEAELAKNEIEYYKINRGGDITFHGPKQIVVYPILDLDYFFTDVHKYVRTLEQAVINTLQQYSIGAGRIEKYTGVWLPKTEEKKERKICAIGVHLSRWVTMHGIAFNVNTDLSYFDNIVPCGIAEEDKEVCSMQSELGREVDYVEVKDRLRKEFEELFNMELYE